MATNYTDGSTPNYTDVATALTRTRERAKATIEDNVLLTDFLRLSSVKTASDDTPSNAVLYRPFLSAALFLEQKQSGLISGDGAVFRRQLEEAAAMRQMQAATDAAFGAVLTENQDAVNFGKTTPKSQSAEIGWY